MSTGVNCKRDDFKDSKEKSLIAFSNGFGASESAGGEEVEYEHLRERVLELELQLER